MRHSSQCFCSLLFRHGILDFVPAACLRTSDGNNSIPMVFARAVAELPAYASLAVIAAITRRVWRSDAMVLPVNLKSLPTHTNKSN